MTVSPISAYETACEMMDGRFIQLCFVVDDIQTGIARYSRLFGAGPWFVGTGFSPTDDPTVFRGVPTPLQTTIALGYSGEMMFELACPMPGSRSIFTEWADRHGFNSLHHYGFGVDDYDDTVDMLRAANIELLMTSRTPRGTRVVMVDADPELNALKEYIELRPATRQFYDFMRIEAENWDRRSLRFAGEIPKLA